MRALAAAFAFVLCIMPLAACAEDAHTVIHLLDYIGADYGEAVERGKVKNADEYEEMRAFAAQVAAGLRDLPANPLKSRLSGQADALVKLVADKAPADAIAAASGKLRLEVADAYEVRTAPRAPPDMARAKALYGQHCATCHGAEGHGNGPKAKDMEPRPADFHDAGRMAKRSVYALHSTITLGVPGTPMPPFQHLSEGDRWALAFAVSNLGTAEARVREGSRLWHEGKGRALFSDLGAVTALSSTEMLERHGTDAARLQDYLRANPQALRRSPIAVARAKLEEAVNAHAAGNRASARQAAISAYLDGFELVEAPLANADRDLMRDIERRMMELRTMIERDTAEELGARARALDGLLASADEKLRAGGLSPASAFTASLIILLREGLEAILVLAAIIAFVIKTGRRDALPWIHGGWIAAVVLGGVTWLSASYAVDISGANRELTEGVTSLAAAAMLLYVGYWLHGKAYADAWSTFIRRQVGRALEKRTLWALAAVSFLAAYREMFEVVLFYQTLWAQAGEAAAGAVLAGTGAAAAALATGAFAIFRYSVRLPLAPFFGATSALLALLAVVFTGHGVAALQEAGLVGVSALGFDALPLLGVYPNRQSLGAQVVVLALVALSFYAARRPHRL